MSKDVVVYSDSEQLISRFVHELDVRPATISSYKKKVAHFAAWLRERNITSPTTGDIVVYKKHLGDSGLAPSSISAYLVAVRRLYSWAAANGLTPNIAQPVKGAKVRRGHAKDAMTVRQIRRVLDACADLRERAIMTLLFTTGLRSIEVIRANVEHLRSLSGQSVLYVKGKGRDEYDDFVILDEHTEVALREYLGSRGAVVPGSPLIVGHGNRNRGRRLGSSTFRRIVTDILKRAKVKSSTITVHSTRHTAVTVALLNGASLQEAQHLARHTNIATTMIYSHNIDRINAGTERRIASAIFDNT